MLLSFRFANHKSFRDEQQLNLTPVYDAPAAEELRALPVVGVFGANASGKSNLIDALKYASNLIGRSDREVEPGLEIRRLAIRRRPFRLDPDRAAEPSSYVFDLRLQGVRYTYGFVLDDERILEEWLYSYPLNRRRKLFQRIRNDFEWGEESGRSELREVAGIVAPTSLFLSAAARFGQVRESPAQAIDESYGVMHRVYLGLYFGILKLGRLNRLNIRDSWTWLARPRRAALIAELLRAADVGLSDIVVSYPDEELAPSKARPSRTRHAEPELHFVHHGASSGVSFEPEDESDGTLQLLRLAQYALDALDGGDVLLLDEIDASLHPLLTAKLIGMFQSEATNPKGAQLIFTSHDATLLGALDGDEVLRRDEIWFTEKNAEGVSTLYPLAEFKPRKEGENRPRRYLNGSYGAIPDLSMQLFEHALASRDSSDRDG
jgi:uncharacterized protein